MEQDVTLSDEQIEEINEVFRLFDTKGDGVIASKDLGSVMRSLGLCPAEEYVQECITELDVDGTGNIHLSKFMALMSRTLHKKDIDEEVRDAFRVFDKDGNGFVGAAKLRHVMTTLGEKLSEVEVEEMLREADKEGHGQVNYEEFVNRMMKLFK